MLSASASHRRVEPSISVNRNVITPGGAGTPAESHNEPGFHLEHHRTTQTTDHEAGRRRPRRLRWQLWIDVVLGARSRWKYDCWRPIVRPTTLADSPISADHRSAFART